MNNPKISVIVPVYNVEKYLPRCIDSILAQTFTDFELLLVDDGSKDRSGEICDEYAMMDSHIKIFHKENGGVSSARNLGLDKAKGEYIVYVDSDDWIGERHLEEMIKFKDNDIVIGGKTVNGDVCGIDKFEKNSIFIDGEIGVALKETLADDKLRVPWAKLYKRKIIEENKLRFDLHMKIAEDTVFVQKYLSHCKSVCFIKTFSYFYYFNKRTSKYKLTAEELIYYLNVTSSVYNALSKKHSFCDDRYLNFIKYFFIRLYLNYISSCPFTFNEYKQMKRCLRTVKADKLKYHPRTLRQKIMYGILRHRCFLILFLIIKRLH